MALPLGLSYLSRRVATCRQCIFHDRNLSCCQRVRYVRFLKQIQRCAATEFSVSIPSWRAQQPLPPGAPYAREYADLPPTSRGHHEEDRVAKEHDQVFSKP